MSSNGTGGRIEMEVVEKSYVNWRGIISRGMHWKEGHSAAAAVWARRERSRLKTLMGHIAMAAQYYYKICSTSNCHISTWEDWAMLMGLHTSWQGLRQTSPRRRDRWYTFIPFEAAWEQSTRETLYERIPGFKLKYISSWTLEPSNHDHKTHNLTLSSRDIARRPVRRLLQSLFVLLSLLVPCIQSISPYAL